MCQQWFPVFYMNGFMGSVLHSYGRVSGRQQKLCSYYVVSSLALELTVIPSWPQEHRDNCITGYAAQEH